MTVIMSEVTNVDSLARVVWTAQGSLIPYDYLVLATGVTTSYFNHPEWAKYAPGLKTIEEARRIRAQILTCFETAERTQDEIVKRNSMTFVIVGGGPTGVELAGSIADIARDVLARDFRHINPRNARILLIEAGQRLLSAFAPEMSDYTRETLEKMGVEVLTGTSVNDCTKDGVELSDGQRLDCCSIVWAAGVRATPVAAWLGAQADRTGRVLVDEFLRVLSHENVFAIGDVAAAKSNGNPIPGLAPAAKQMGRFVGDFISSHVARSDSKPKAFVYRHQGDLATIGRRSAIVSMKHLHLRGMLAWVFWSVVHIYFLIGLRNRLAVALSWIWEYVTLQRGARLI
jgi:NADH:ubiquinone reductase (H+-translocating)